MQDTARMQLARLLHYEGSALAHDPPRLEAFLKDTIPSLTAEVFLLSSAARLGIVRDLTTQARPVLVEKCYEELAVTREAAVWAVETWHRVLTEPYQEPPPPPPPPAPPKVEARPAVNKPPRPEPTVVAPQAPRAAPAKAASGTRTASTPSSQPATPKASGTPKATRLSKKIGFSTAGVALWVVGAFGFLARGASDATPSILGWGEAWAAVLDVICAIGGILVGLNSNHKFWGSIGGFIAGAIVGAIGGWLVGATLAAIFQALSGQATAILLWALALGTLAGFIGERIARESR